MTLHFRGWLCAAVASLLALVLYATPGGSGAESGGKSFMWRVGEGENQVYILGSLHMLKPGFYPLPSEIEEAFIRSKALVVEIDESQGDPLQRQLLTLQRATYAGDETLSSRLSPKTRAALEEYLAKSGQRGIAFQKMRPWFASLMILMKELVKAGFNPQEGIDRHFLAEAKSQNKEVLQLETAEFQIQLLSDFPEELQDKLLLSTLVGAKEMDKESEVLVDAWRRGDAHAMNEAITKNERQYPELESVQNKLLYERNGPMVDKIEGYLKDGGTYFVVVGAGHLVGDRGIIELLRKRQYKVEQIKHAPAAAPVKKTDSSTDHRCAS